MVRKSSRKDYTGFSIQKDKVDEIKKFIVEHPEFHYQTVIDFINEAIKEKLNKKVTVVKSEELETISGQLTKISGQIKNISDVVKGDNTT